MLMSQQSGSNIGAMVNQTEMELGLSRNAHARFDETNDVIDPERGDKVIEN